MIRRSQRPLTDAERAELERPIYEQPGNLAVHFLFGLLGAVPGALLAVAGGAGLWNLGYFPAIGAKVFLAAVSVVVGGIGLYFLRFGVGTWIAAFPRTPVLLRPARDLRGASAEVVEIVAQRGWFIDTGNDDVGRALLLRSHVGTYALLGCEEVDGLSEEDAEVTPCETLTIARFETELLSVTNAGAPIPTTRVPAQEINPEGWIDDELDIPEETELSHGQLTPALQRLVEQDTPASDLPSGH